MADSSAAEPARSGCLGVSEFAVGDVVEWRGSDEEVGFGEQGTVEALEDDGRL